MAIDGFSVNLGKPAQGAELKTLVDKKAVSDLIAQAKGDQRFREAAGKYEFRLREKNGDAVLELRRPTTGFFAKIWGGGRRSAERTAAYEALRTQLPGMKERPADAGALRKADARTLAAQALKLHDLQEAAAGKTVFAGLSATDQEVRDVLVELRGNGTKDRVIDQPLVPGFNVRAQTKTLLDRSDVSVDDVGRLRIKTPGSAGDASQRLETIIAHVAKETGLERTSAQFKAIVENLLTTIRSGCDRQIATLVETQTGRRFDTTAYSGTPEHLELAFRVSPLSIGVNVSLTAPVTIGDFAAPAAVESSTARLEYRLPVEELSKPEDSFDIGSAVKDIQFEGGDKGYVPGKSQDDITEDSIRTVRQKNAERAAAGNEPEFRMDYAPGTVTSHQRVKVEY
jgi:hypothetical protein